MDSFICDVYATFSKLTGGELDAHHSFYIKEYDRGGMSGGDVSGKAWEQRLLALLLIRLDEENKKANKAEYGINCYVDISDIELCKGKMVFSSSSGKNILMVIYDSKYLLSVSSFIDAYLKNAYQIKLTKIKTRQIMYSCEVTDEFLLNEAVKNAEKKAEELLILQLE